MEIGFVDVGGFVIGTDGDSAFASAPTPSPPPGPAPSPAPAPAPSTPRGAFYVSFTPLPDPPSRNDPTNFNDRADALFEALPIFVQEANTLIPGETAAGLAQFLANTGTGKGASLIACINDDADSVQRTVEDKLRERVSAFDYMSSSERAAVRAFTFTTDVTTALQKALNRAHASHRDLFIPAGGYLVTGLTIPGNVVTGGTDDRDKAFRIYGQGCGEPFVTRNTGGTIIKSTTNAPVLQDILGTNPSSNGTVEIDHIRFDGTSTTPVVLLQSFYGTSSFHHNVIYQRSTGDGLKITYNATGHIHDCYAINKDFATFGLGASRTGIGFNFENSWDSGLTTFRKCSSRGWLVGFKIGGGAGTCYSPAVLQCECSVTRNGIILSGTRKALVSGNYMEAGDGGTGISDGGDYSTIRDNLVFTGFTRGIDASDTTTKGTLIEANIVSTGSVANAKAIMVGSSAAFGGYNKNVVNNSLVYALGTAGVSGIEITGTDPRVNVTGNMFDPRSAWTGSGTNKIVDASTSGVYGLVQVPTGDRELLHLSRAMVSLDTAATALTQADVSGGVLSIPATGNYFVMTATSAVSVTQFSLGSAPSREITIRFTNTNTTITEGSFITLTGASFNAIGSITLIVERVGSSHFAYEKSRAPY